MIINNYRNHYFEKNILSTKSDNIIKVPHSLTEYSTQERIDLVRCSIDPLYFTKFVKIQHAMKGAVPFEPYPFQEKMIRAFNEKRFVIGCTSRQMGKCVTYDTMIKHNDKEIEIGSLLKLSFKEKIINFLERLMIKIASS